MTEPKYTRHLELLVRLTDRGVDFPVIGSPPEKCEDCPLMHEYSGFTCYGNMCLAAPKSKIDGADVNDEVDPRDAPPPWCVFQEEPAEVDSGYDPRRRMREAIASLPEAAPALERSEQDIEKEPTGN